MNDDDDDDDARGIGDTMHAADISPPPAAPQRGSPFANAAAAAKAAQPPRRPPSPLAMRHERRRRPGVADSGGSSSCDDTNDNDADERAPTCLSRLEHAEAAAALSLPVGAWPHFRLLQRVLRARAEARWRRRHGRRRAEAEEENGREDASWPPPRTVPLGTLVAIHAQEAQHRASRLHPQHRVAMPGIARRYWPWPSPATGPLSPSAAPAPPPPPTPGGDLIELAAAADMPPCLLVRRLAEHLLRAPKGAVAEALRDASGAAMRRLADKAAAVAAAGAAGAAAPPPPCTSAPAAPLTASYYHALADALLRDAARAALADPSYSPAADAARALAGHEGEAALGAALRRAGVPFWTEADLRARGLFKTPDAWLQAPAAVRVPRGRRRRRRENEASAAAARVMTTTQGGATTGSAAPCFEDGDDDDDEEPGQEDDWRVVHWVDSKACFGDARAHAAALEGQYRQYADRYGPGLVVYWAGHASGLEGATWPGWRDDLRRDAREAAEADGEEGEARGGGPAEVGGAGGGQQVAAGAAAPGGADGDAPPPWLVVVMDRFPGPEDVRLLPRVRLTADEAGGGAAAAAAAAAGGAAAAAAAAGI
jgi:hypothetical protein